MLKKEHGNDASILSFNKYVREQKMSQNPAKVSKYAAGTTGFDLDMKKGTDGLDDSFKMYEQY